MDRGFLNLEWYLQYRISWSSKAYCARLAQLAFSVMLKWQFNIVLYTVRLLNLYYLAGKKSRLPACSHSASGEWMLHCVVSPFLPCWTLSGEMHSALTQSRAGTAILCWPHLRRKPICVDSDCEEFYLQLPLRYAQHNWNGTQEDTETPQNEVPLALSQSGMLGQHVVPPFKYEKNRILRLVALVDEESRACVFIHS